MSSPAPVDGVPERNGKRAFATADGHMKWKWHESDPIIPSSEIRFPRSEDIYDLVCVGFGPASLAIAIALHDAFEYLPISVRRPKVIYLERQSQFRWHAGMLLPGAKMQISFIKDLATLRNPRSKFTFLNYLQQQNRLVPFSNVGSFLPSRLEFEKYMSWCSSHFDAQTTYDQDVLRVLPAKSQPQKALFDLFSVTSINSKNFVQLTCHARHVIIAVGGKPAVPSTIPANMPRIIHSSMYTEAISKLLPRRERAYSIAILGSGQSAAECFNDLHARYPNAETVLIFRDTALRPSDDSPFVNEVFDPSKVDAFYSQSASSRKQAIHSDRSTNYSVVRLELLEHIYSMLYDQLVQEPDKAKHQHRILPCRELRGVQDDPDNKQIKITLCPANAHSTGETAEVLAVNVLILATGYLRESHKELLKGCQAVNSTSHGTWEVERNYSVKLDGTKMDTGKAGVWLQGCNEATHGLSDSLLSILAVRGGELVESIFGKDIRQGQRQACSS